MSRMGSAGATAWIAHLSFWILLISGLTSGELGTRGVLVALAAWALGYVGLSYVGYGPPLFPSYVAVVDVVLVFVIFKGDVHIS
jgi:hypothetical protein